MNEQTVPSTTEASIVHKTSIQLELTKAGLNYQNILQGGENIKFSKDSLAAGQAELTPLKQAKKAMDDLENPYTTKWRQWNEAKASLYKPITELLTRKTTELSKLNKEVSDENARLAAAETRKTNIQAAISVFTLEYSTKIASATKTEELVTLQKRIGAEKSRSGFYGEFMPELNQAVEGLEKALKEQKEHVQQLDALQDQKKNAQAQGDEEKLVELLDKESTITAKIDDTRAGVQEQAINRATAFVAPEVARVMPTVKAKATRTVWMWEVVDLDVFAKRHPKMISMSPNKSAIDEMIRDLKASETIVEGVFHGLKIYQKEYL